MTRSEYKKEVINMKIEKFTVTLELNKCTGRFKILKIFDNRTREDVTKKYFELCPTFKSGFMDTADVMESLNWCLNGDSSHYKISYGRENKTHIAHAYIFD